MLKFLMSFLVVAIHTGLSEMSVMRYFCSLAVPLFFMITGYLLFQRINLSMDNDKQIKRVADEVINPYVSKIAKLYLFWTILYLPITIYGFIIGEETFLRSIIIFFRNITLVGENYLSWSLWYLLALIVSLLMIKWLLKQKVKLEVMIIIGIALTYAGVLIADLLQSEPEGILKLIKEVYSVSFWTPRNGIFVGYAFVVMGMLLAKYETRLYNIPFLCLTVFVVSIIAYLNDVFFALHLVFFFLLYYTLQLKLPNACFCLLLRKASGLIYFSHMYFVAILMIFYPWITSPIVKFIVISLLVTIFSVFVLFLIETNRVPALKKLIS